MMTAMVTDLPVLLDACTAVVQAPCCSGNVLPKPGFGASLSVIKRSSSASLQRLSALSQGQQRAGSERLQFGYVRSPCVSASLATEEQKPTAASFGKVRLGETSVEVPQIGIGAWSWGDKFYWNEGEWNDRKVKDAKFSFEASMDVGLGFFDTAEVYGTKQFGGEDSESLLGRFIRERERKDGDQPVVATKYAALPWRLGRKSVVSTLKESLERLRLPSVDLYQLHWPGVWGNEGYIDGLADCVEQGLTKAIGVSNYSEERLRKAHKQLAARGVPLASNQVHYNLLYRLPEENGVKKTCEELGVALIAYSPLAQGMLSGKYTAANPPKGPRASSYSPEFLTKSAPLLRRMKELGSQYEKTPIQIALNWLISGQGNGTVVPIPGAKTKEQAQEFAGALGWSLTPEEVAELRSLASVVPPIQGFPVEKF
eukprot:TRINITY_DN27962_c0_g1_i1.p1 TRINITY_DN27962_c0_g1~~TRINITY_DN27962_c0_g1_i1.p1  ORF type:complete len:427 (-),score=56.36 TRINITY_DN27962_c0_g1_i1:483-1763(-)